MTSMAATSNARLYYPEHLHKAKKKNVAMAREVLRTDLFVLRIGSIRKRSLSLKASSSSSSSSSSFQEVVPFYLDRDSIAAEDIDNEKINKLTDETAERIRSGLAPRWSDMDANQHVNNVKYIGWILESVPIDVLEDYNLTSMTLEYRRECRQSNLLESLTSIKEKEAEDSNNGTHNCRTELESTHLLRMEDDKAEIVRARSEWQSKSKK